jgi:hypothetical protein
MEDLLNAWPWWVAAVVLVGVVVAGKRFPAVKGALSPVRAAAVARLKRVVWRMPKLTAVPQPLDPERDPSLPDAVIGTDGPPPENESGSGG